MARRSHFNDIAQLLMDRSLALPDHGDGTPLHAGLTERFGIKMSLVIVHIAEDDMDWRMSWIRPYGFSTKIFDISRFCPQGRFGDWPDTAYLRTAVIPAYRAALADRKPRMERVTTPLLGFNVGYDRLLLPQRAAEPAWCLSFTEGRFLMPRAPIAVSSDDTDERIAQYLIEGQTPKEMSPMLALSQRTIEHRIDRMKQRYDARNVAHLTSKLVSERLQPGHP